MSGRGFYLAVDTATEACSAAVWLDGAVRERYLVAERDHTRRLLPMVQELLAESGRGAAQLDGVACGVGPGSFAGVRIGVGFAKGLALARDLPVVGVSSLRMLALRAASDGAAGHIVTVIDARMNQVYFGAWERASGGALAAVVEERCCDPSAAPRLPAAGWLAVGTGWGPHGEALRAATRIAATRIDATALPHAEDAVRWAAAEFAAGRGGTADALAPAYLRDRVALTLDEQRRLRGGG